jgi:hypothetical protein
MRIKFDRSTSTGASLGSISFQFLPHLLGDYVLDDTIAVKKLKLKISFMFAHVCIDLF